MDKKVKALVEHWKAEDKRGDEIKESVGKTLAELADFIEANWGYFRRDPKRTMQAFAVKYMRENTGLFSDAKKSADRFLKAVK